MASQNGHTEVVKLLLDKGADVNVKDAAGFTALRIAKKYDNTGSPNSFQITIARGISKHPGECMIQCEKENLPLGCASNIATCVKCLKEVENKYRACLKNNCGYSKEDAAFRRSYRA